MGPGGDGHAVGGYYPLSVEDVVTLQQADVILKNGAGYAAWMRTTTLPASRLVDTSVAFGDRLVARTDDVTHTHGPGGDHDHGTTAFTTWLDPELAILHATAVRNAVAAKRSEATESLDARLAALTSDLRALDERLAAAIRQAPERAVVFSHPVYDYLASRYGMNGRSVHWEPDAAPTEEQWAELEGVSSESGAKWMIWEGQPLAETITELERRGVKSVVFSPCGNRPEDGDLLTILGDGAAVLERLYGAAE